MKTKTILLAAGAVIVGSSIIAYNKTQRLIQIFDKMTIKPASLPKKVKINLQTISFNIDIMLTNPTGEDFAVSGGIATLRQIAIYFKGQLLGYAQTNITTVSIPSYDKIIIHDIPVTFATINLVEVAGGAGIPNADMLNQFVYQGTIEVLGQYITVG